MKAFSTARHVAGGLFNALAELGSVRMTPPRDMRAAAHRLAGALGTVARAHDLQVTIRGEVPRSVALIVSNHVSYLDPLVVLPICPALPVAKGEVASWPIVGPIGTALGTMFVRRDDPMSRARVLRRIHDLLACGVPVLNFAEGTTTRGTSVGPFWRGGFGVAQRLGVPVVPVVIRYRDPEMAWCDGATFFPHYLRTAGQRRIEVAVVFGSPMHARTGETPEAMAARTRGVISHLLDLTWWTDAGLRAQLSSPRPDPVLPPSRIT
ncbi:MAG: 1-acyl-sn-glycerol-3-phosphate acyltransferase [Deltaproteobacteria bacterium]|nr:1-acyl-sn-glycerol-3-phosphate acyltransferase [Deltaproteobacteria bacterium]